MAVPKKRTSKSKKNMRRSHWRRQANQQATKALSLAKSVLSGESHGFIFWVDGPEETPAEPTS
uniref:Large ribosomal subunit protein bL32c n=1 Tax=Nephroselmis pyriformis TaxID=156128 RepID=A0A8A2H8K0_9CHLO|nr:ribosomal protein L32 [Nephroselmis pyriformis]QSV37323.1 ribosomal protein L32 [Nephroselmis pyriformis]